MAAEGILPSSNVRWISGSRSATTRSTLIVWATAFWEAARAIAATMAAINRCVARVHPYLNLFMWIPFLRGSHVFPFCIFHFSLDHRRSLDATWTLADDK